MTTVYSSYSAWSDKKRAAVKCDECGTILGIDILPGTTVRQNRDKLEGLAILRGWSLDLDSDAPCLCGQHNKEEQ